jgi:hypothetical protein
VPRSRVGSILEDCLLIWKRDVNSRAEAAVQAYGAGDGGAALLRVAPTSAPFYTQLACCPRQPTANPSEGAFDSDSPW